MIGTSRRASARLLLAAFMVACATAAGARESGIAPVNGARLAYEIQGESDEPVVVLLQGGQLPMEMWDDQFDFLAKDFRVIRYDARGFGKSSPLRGPYAYHEDLHALLKHLGVARASLVGLSLGGRVAIDFALEHPEMVSALVLAGPGLSGFAWDTTPDPTTPRAIAAWRARDSVQVALIWLETGYMKHAMRDSALARRLRELSTRNASLWMQPDSERVIVPPAVGRLSAIRAPTLVILGERDVRDIHRIVDTLTKTIPGARRVVIPDVGHMPNMEKPADFNRIVREFLKSARDD